jgi:cytidine deaminase
MIENDNLEYLIDLLVPAARAAAQNAYVPYSEKATGAALLTDASVIYCGAAVENSVFSVSVSAERAAVVAAVSAGETSFEALAVYSMGEDPVFPSGEGTDALAEFCDKILLIAACDEKMVTKELKLK